ncbi:MAG: alpha/beta hydrolase fold domain-containing protein [Oscillospiraceae bacterium]|nr:alpha/beta hydrolase fold domain-containing protein [Oscillospiraceae bacterium]
MHTKTIVLNAERGVTLTAMIQEVGGEFRGVTARPAVLVIPGGGYMFCSDREADPVAMPFLAAGFQAFVLRYSVGAQGGWPKPLEDYEQAMSLIRENAEKWHVIPDQIAVIGFSAGGHLAGAAAVMSENRPNAAILGYAVLRSDTAAEIGVKIPGIAELVDEKTCPCFLFATRTDSVVPIQNTLDMMNALNRFHTSFECHIYGYGPHGFSTGDAAVLGSGVLLPKRAADWVDDSIAWLRDLFGSITADGQEAPVCRPHVTDDGEAWLSLDCSIGRIFGNSEAVRVLADTIEVMRRELVPFTPDMSFEDMIRAVSNMTLRALLSERGIENDRFDELNAALNRIPNI